MRKTSILYNMSILVTAGAFVKILGIINKIIITRILGVEGISMYSIMMPTVMLLLGICSFSLSTSIQNIVSNNVNKQTYSNRDLIIKSFMLSTLLCSVISLITLIFNYYICHYLLKMDELQNAFIYFIPMYFFASYGGILKGYYHGHNKLNIYAFAQAFEQVVRITLSLIIILISDNLSLETCLILVVLSMGIGEFFQFIFLVIYTLFFTKINNKTYITYNYGDFVKTSFTLTINRLISSISFFFEPIVFTYAFILTGMSSIIATTYFGILHGYVLPIIATASFISTSLQQAILPSLIMNKNNSKKTCDIISKSMFLSFVPGLLLFYILYFYNKEILTIIYGTSIGSNYLKLMSLSVFISYFDGVFSSILLVNKYEKKMLLFNIFTSITKLVLLFILVQIPKLNAYGLPLWYSFISILCSLYGFSKLTKLTDYKIKITSIILVIISIICILSLGYLYYYNLNMILSIFLTSSIFLICSLIYYRTNFKEHLLCKS